MIILELTGSSMWGTGSYEHRSTGVGSMPPAGNLIIQPCFAMEIRGWARRTSRKGTRLPLSKVLLRNCDSSSLVIDRICDWAMGRNATVVCFYFDFAAQKEQSPTAVLSSLLRQLVQGLERIPAKIVQGFRDQKAAGGRRLGLDQVVEMLQDLSTSRRTFICIDAIDECVAEYRAKLFVSLKKILRKSLNTRIFLAGRSHIQDELEKHLRMAVAISTTPTRDDIIRFLRAKLKEDTIPDAMDENLEEEIVETIPATVSEM